MQRQIVTHSSPDWDAIGSVWLLNTFLPGWESAQTVFVPAGMRHQYSIAPDRDIEVIQGKETIHVDTGMGPLDHHQTSSMEVCAASIVWEYVKTRNPALSHPTDQMKRRMRAVSEIVEYIVALDHFQEVFWPDAADVRNEFGLYGLLEGYKSQHPNDDAGYITFGMLLLDAMIHRLEEVQWARDQIDTEGITFQIKDGRCLALETINDEVMKLAQKMGFVLVIRKDPRKGYVRIKAGPRQRGEEEAGIDLTQAYEQLKKMDPHATWFLHVSKKMLLNGSPKNPKMVPSTLTLKQLKEVIMHIYG
jgi:hypothetical protein